MLNAIRQLFGLEQSKMSLVGIFIAEAGGQQMNALTSIQAVKGGLKGDRYCSGKGYWHRVEACQVTLISEDDLKLARRGNSLNFDNGNHRRNLVVSGLKTKVLVGKTFRIGEVIFQYIKPRPPCGYLNKIEGPGMSLALSYNSGICLDVLKEGELSVGDEVEILSQG